MHTDNRETFAQAYRWYRGVGFGRWSSFRQSIVQIYNV